MDTQSKPPESERDSAHNRPCEAEAEGVTVTDQEEDQEKPWEDGDEEESVEMPGPAAAPAAAAEEEDISNNPQEDPRRPILQKYPTRPFGNQQRCFYKGWMDQHVWLEYSVSKDAAFCFACWHFSKRVHRVQPAFICNGFNKWRKASATLNTHHESAAHKFAVETWSEFKQKQTSGSKIANMIDKGHSALVMENRKYMQAVVESLSYTACQGIAQRGHSEGGGSSNRGNFLELLHLIKMFDVTVDKKLASNPSNAKYTYHDIQNELFDIMADMIRK